MDCRLTTCNVYPYIFNIPFLSSILFDDGCIVDRNGLTLSQPPVQRCTKYLCELATMAVRGLTMFCYRVTCRPNPFLYKCRLNTHGCCDLVSMVELEYGYSVHGKVSPCRCMCFVRGAPFDCQGGPWSFFKEKMSQNKMKNKSVLGLCNFYS